MITENDIPDVAERLAANVQAVFDSTERGLIPGVCAGDESAILMPEGGGRERLEFPCVAIGGLGELKKPGDIEDDIRLTYVAITRATHEAFITYSNMSELVGRLVV